VPNHIREWWVELERLERALHEAGPDAVGCEGLSPRQCTILRTLAAREGTRLTDLAQLVGITPSALTRVVEKLEKLGFIQRVRGKFEDGRASMVAITPLGRNVRARIDELMLHRTDEIVSAIPAGNRAGLLRAVRMLNRALESPGCCDRRAQAEATGKVRSSERRQSSAKIA
jgi:DNA-binding MarR family transcriptional regulator